MASFVPPCFLAVPAAVLCRGGSVRSAVHHRCGAKYSKYWPWLIQSTEVGLAPLETQLPLIRSRQPGWSWGNPWGKRCDLHRVKV